MPPPRPSGGGSSPWPDGSPARLAASPCIFPERWPWEEKVSSRPGTAASHSTPGLTAPVRHCPNVRSNVRPTERPRQLAPSRSASPSRRVLSRHFAHHSHCRPPSAPPKAPADRRQPPVYPNSSPDHRACNSLTPLPCPRAVHPCPSVDSGLTGFELVFFRDRRTVSLLMLSTISRCTI